MKIQEIMFMPFCLLFLSASAMAVTGNDGGNRHGIKVNHEGYLVSGQAFGPEIIPASRPESRVPAELLEELSRYRILSSPE